MSSAKMQPIDHKSTAQLYVLPPSRISGARYHRVTTYSRAAVQPDATGAGTELPSSEGVQTSLLQRDLICWHLLTGLLH